MKTKIKKHIRKCIPFVLTLFIIPVFTVNSFAYSYDGHNVIDVLDGASLYNVETFDFSNTDYANIADAFASDTAFCFYGNQGQTIARIGNIVIPKESKVVVTITTFELKYNSGDYTLQTGSDNTLSKVEFYLGYINGTTVLRGYSRGNTGFTYGGCRNTITFNHTSSNEITNLDVVIYNDKTANNPPLETKQPIYVLNIYALPNNATDETLNTFMSLVNSKLQQLIEGNSDTNNALSDFNEVFEDFNSELQNIESFDSSVIGQFEDANEQYLTELNNFSLSASLLNAGNWLSTSMQTVYDNSSDYKMLWLVPLLLGIPLIILFLKKGSDDE